MNIKKILKSLKDKSNISYSYYHVFYDFLIELDYKISYPKINHIVYIIESSFTKLLDFYLDNREDPITDIFLERLSLSFEEKKILFSFYFKDLFRLRLSNVRLDPEDYLGMSSFFVKHAKNINRIFIEDCNVTGGFFKHFHGYKTFENLTFLSLDNNDISQITYLDTLVGFIKNQTLGLEYLSLVNCQITEGSFLLETDLFIRLRILDISHNSIEGEKISKLILGNHKKLRELYIKGIIFTNEDIEKILGFLEEKESLLDVIFLSLLEDQRDAFEERLLNIGSKYGMHIKIFGFNKREKISSTISFKVLEKGQEHICNDLNKADNFCAIRREKFEIDFQKTLIQKGEVLKEGINLFLFDFNDYQKIDVLLTKYSFNYIYLENYFITDKDLESFLKTLAQKKNQPYKINLISIELSSTQLDYLLEFLPKNIYFIEINLNKIIEKREKYIQRMLKNDAFIFENKELYQKIFT